MSHDDVIQTFGLIHLILHLRPGTLQDFKQEVILRLMQEMDHFTRQYVYDVHYGFQF